MDLLTPIEKIIRISPRYQKRLIRLGIKTVKELFYHFPHRYEDFSSVIPISKATMGEKACLVGEILEIKNTKTWKKRLILTQAIIQDDTGTIKAVWFNQPYLIKVLKKGDFVCLAGKINFDEYGKYIQSPAYEKILKNKSKNQNYLIHTGRLVPIYPETEGLSSRWLRTILRPLLFNFNEKIKEFLPEEIIKKHKLLNLKKALWQIHFPDNIDLAKRAKERFSFEELFLIELFVLKERMVLNKEKAFRIPLNLKLITDFVKSLPFELTFAQKRCAFQILKDLQKPKPMNRLLQGDVGSGKTIVAMMASLNVAKNGYQVALMAPTEILAKQHFKNFNHFLKRFDLKIGLLVSKEAQLSDKKLPKKELLEALIQQKCDILVGTHALIEEGIIFSALAFVILDEQHRFGVEQRAKLLKQKSGIERKIPHLLSMTATPIPRTLALTIYGDLDLSLLDELPRGRKKIITKIISPKEREKTYDFIRDEIKKGRQAFVICPRIEPNNKNQEKNKIVLSWAEVKAVKEEREKLSKMVFPEFKVEMLHGKMKSQEKERIMQDFLIGKIQVLVSTSVVEVGVDVPNATIMIIEGAERFGLSQLHQFRGRVGRGEKQSFCFLFTESPARKTWQRLEALLSSENGFELAEKDLKIRGPGEIFGARQWGIPDFAMESLKDIFLVEKARNSAKEILEKDPDLKAFPLLRQKLEEIKKRIHLE